MRQVSVEEAATKLNELLSQVAQGEEILLTLGDLPVAKLVPAPPPPGPRPLGLAKGLITIADDFDAPLPEFEESR